jgi:Secretion system C-terminal sorting domain/Putative flagellar system-associated repeat/Bacterial Ig-like domain (group 2)
MRKVLIILFLAISSILSAANYYVKNGGSDGAFGTSDATAWAHHPWMSTWTGHVTLVAGDNVFMKRGDTWIIANPTAAFIFTAQSGTAGRSITTAAYGTGNDPVIKISTNSNYPVIRVYGDSYLTFDHLHIQHYSSTYSGSDMCGILITKKGIIAPHHINITNCEMDNIPRTCVEGNDDSHHIVIGDTTASHTATATNYSNHFHDFGYAGVSLLGCDPLSPHESHFDVYYNYVHDATGTNSGDNEYGIYFGASPSSTAWPKYATARYNKVENIGTWEGIDMHGGSYMYFQDNYIKNVGSAGFEILGTKNIGTLPVVCDNVYVERNIIEQPSSGWITGHEDAFIRHCNDETSTNGTNIYIRDNTLFYSLRPDAGSFCGIRSSNVNGLTISGNSIYNGSTASGEAGILLETTAAFGDKNVIVNGNFILQWGPGVALKGSAVTGALAITNNVITKPTLNACIKVQDNDISATGILTLYNNVLISNSYSCIFETLYGINAGGVVTAKNNIFGRQSVGALYYWNWEGTIAGTFTCDFNVYWNSTYATPFYLRGTYHNWTDWNMNGYDNHSLNNTDPLFMNKSGSYSESLDFVLQSTSPAINKGTVVSEVTSDFFGNPRNATPDIGAYEHIVPVSGITVTGAAGSNTITTENGTLQLSAAISPSNATNKTVTWSVTNGTGQATINSAGLVSATGNGTVTARATATDGSGVYGTLFITITNQIVTDSLVFLNSVIENNSPAVLEVVYNFTVADVIPATSAFSVIVNSTARNINTMTISGTKVFLTLASPVVNSDIVTVAYSKPSSNPLQAASGGQAASVGPLPVTNKVSPKSYVPNPVKIFPNPAHDFINIQIVEPTLVPDLIKIIDLTGKIVFQNKVKPDIKDFQIPINLKQGVYIVQMGSGNQILFTQKLIVAI